MARFDRRHRRRNRRSRKRGSTPWVIVSAVICTVFLSVEWRAKLLPVVMGIGGAGSNRARLRWTVARKPTDNYNVNRGLLHMSREHVGHGIVKRDPVAKTRTQHSVHNVKSMRKPRQSLQNLNVQHGSNGRSHIPQRPRPNTTTSTTPKPHPNSPTQHIPNPRNNTCTAYLCQLWATIPDHVQLPVLHSNTYPWLHGAITNPTNPSSHRSIFTARRKGPWMGCSRRDAVLCTGVYRALKRTAASTLYDIDCARHIHWIPRVLDKLMGEYRVIRMICGVHHTRQLRIVQRMYAAAPRVRIMLVEHGQHPPADVVLVRHSLVQGNLITAMALLKSIRASGRYSFIVHGNFPRERGNFVRRHVLRINAALPPFSLPPPFYSHQDDSDEEIVCRVVHHMFLSRTTPSMRDLVDPRRRVVMD